MLVLGWTCVIYRLIDNRGRWLKGDSYWLLVLPFFAVVMRRNHDVERSMGESKYQQWAGRQVLSLRYKSFVLIRRFVVGHSL